MFFLVIYYLQRRKYFDNGTLTLGRSFKFDDWNSTVWWFPARLDIKANRLFDSWFYRTFFYVKICNPFAKSCPKQNQEANKQHKASKKRKFEQRIIHIEKSSFSPLVSAIRDYRRSRTARIENRHKTYGQAQQKNFLAVRWCRRIYQDEG